MLPRDRRLLLHSLSKIPSYRARVLSPVGHLIFVGAERLSWSPPPPRNLQFYSILFCFFIAYPSCWDSSTIFTNVCVSFAGSPCFRVLCQEFDTEWTAANLGLNEEMITIERQRASDCICSLFSSNDSVSCLEGNKHFELMYHRWVFFGTQSICEL